VDSARTSATVLAFSRDTGFKLDLCVGGERFEQSSDLVDVRWYEPHFSHGIPHRLPELAVAALAGGYGMERLDWASLFQHRSRHVQQSFRGA
jgi:hypothetical protein